MFWYVKSKSNGKVVAVNEIKEANKIAEEMKDAIIYSSDFYDIFENCHILG